MFKIYFYPRIEYKGGATPNPYILNFISSLSVKNSVANTYFNKMGVLDFFKYLFKVDIYLFNWIENLSMRRYGKLQIVLFPVFLFIAKITKKKIVWILHNRYSHDRRNRRSTDRMFRTMMKHSNLIITHSYSGIEFVQEQYPKCVYKVRYIIHPVNKLISNALAKKQTYDFLIWGVIHPYKGVLEFLKFVNDTSAMRALKILIVGKCPDKDYKSQINRYLSENIVHFDKYYKLDEIADFADQSKFTLFTYKPESVLSSGSLMDSIGMGSIVIGPDVGAFKDLSSFNFVDTYKNYNDILDIYSNFSKDRDSISSEIDKFCLENTWSNFGEKLNAELTKSL